MKEKVNMAQFRKRVLEKEIKDVKDEQAKNMKVSSSFHLYYLECDIPLHRSSTFLLPYTQTMLEKSDNDDKYIRALKVELHKIKNKPPVI